jgi:hypothetical protein
MVRLAAARRFFLRQNDIVGEWSSIIPMALLITLRFCLGCCSVS